MQLPGASDSDGLGFSPQFTVTAGALAFLLGSLSMQAGWVSTAVISRGAPGEGGSICCWLAGRKDTFAITMGSDDTQVFVPTLLLLPVAS